MCYTLQTQAAAYWLYTYDMASQRRGQERQDVYSTGKELGRGENKA